MRLRSALVLTLALPPLLAACAQIPPAPPRGDPANCRALFESYDQAVKLFPHYSLGPDDRSQQNATVSRAANRLIAAGCLTTGRDIGGIDALGMTLGPREPVDSGPAIPPTAVHVGILTGGFIDASRAVAFFSSQGYDTRTIGAEKLGRRLYIGPVRTEGGLDQAIALAAEAGFPSAYPSDLFSFWKY